MGRVKVAAAAVAAVLLAGATACGERSEPVGKTVPLYPITVTDASDRQVAASAQPRRIAALAPAAGEIVRALGLGSRLVGPPEGFFGSKGELLVAKLRAAKPDLILAAPGPPVFARRLAEVPASVYYVPQDSIADVERAIEQLGLLLDRPVKARVLVHRIEEARATVRLKLAESPTVSVFLDTGFFITVPDGSLAGDLIREAKGRNVAGAAASGEPFDLGRLLDVNPDVYLATSDSNTTLDSLRKNPQTRKLKAVKSGRFHVIDIALLDPGPQVGEGLLELAKLLHPNAFR